MQRFLHQKEAAYSEYNSLEERIGQFEFTKICKDFQFINDNLEDEQINELFNIVKEQDATNDDQVSLIELDKLLNTLFDQLVPAEVILGFGEISDTLREIFDKLFISSEVQQIKYSDLETNVKSQVQDGNEDQVLRHVKSLQNSKGMVSRNSLSDKIEELQDKALFQNSQSRVMQQSSTDISSPLEKPQQDEFNRHTIFRQRATFIQESEQGMKDNFSEREFTDSVKNHMTKIIRIIQKLVDQNEKEGQNSQQTKVLEGVIDQIAQTSDSFRVLEQFFDANDELVQNSRAQARDVEGLMQNKVDELEHELQSTEQFIQRLREENTEMTQKIETLKKYNNQKEEMQQSDQNNQQHLIQNINELHEEIRLQQQEFKALEKELDRRDDKVSELKEEVVILTKKLNITMTESVFQTKENREIFEKLTEKSRLLGSALGEDHKSEEHEAMDQEIQKLRNILENERMDSKRLLDQVEQLEIKIQTFEEEEQEKRQQYLSSSMNFAQGRNSLRQSILNKPQPGPSPFQQDDQAQNDEIIEEEVIIKRSVPQLETEANPNQEEDCKSADNQNSQQIEVLIEENRNYQQKIEELNTKITEIQDSIEKKLRFQREELDDKIKENHSKNQVMMKTMETKLVSFYQAQVRKLEENLSRKCQQYDEALLQIEEISQGKLKKENADDLIKDNVAKNPQPQIVYKEKIVEVPIIVEPSQPTVYQPDEIVKQQLTLLKDEIDFNKKQVLQLQAKLKQSEKDNDEYQQKMIALLNAEQQIPEDQKEQRKQLKEILFEQNMLKQADEQIKTENQKLLKDLADSESNKNALEKEYLSLKRLYNQMIDQEKESSNTETDQEQLKAQATLKEEIEALKKQLSDKEAHVKSLEETHFKSQQAFEDMKDITQSVIQEKVELQSVLSKQASRQDLPNEDELVEKKEKKVEFPERANFKKMEMGKVIDFLKMKTNVALSNEVAGNTNKNNNIKEAPKPKPINYLINDFMKFASNLYILQQLKAKVGEGNLTNNKIYTDQVARINSLGKRKLKFIMITNTYIHTFTPKNNNKHELKMSIPLKGIKSIKWAKNNSSLLMLEINPKFITAKNKKDMFDQILESFRRKPLTLFLKQQIKAAGNNDLRVVQTAAIQQTNRYGDKKVYNTQEKNILKTELQEMFDKAEMLGYVSLQRPSLIGGPKLVKFMIVLSNLGLIVLDIGSLEFKGFIPILGIQIRDSRKIEYANGIELVQNSFNTIVDIIVFINQEDKKDWVNKIYKVQEKYQKEDEIRKTKVFN